MIVRHLRNVNLATKIGVPRLPDCFLSFFLVIIQLEGYCMNNRAEARLSSVAGHLRSNITTASASTSTATSPSQHSAMASSFKQEAHQLLGRRFSRLPLTAACMLAGEDLGLISYVLDMLFMTFNSHSWPK